MSKAFLSYKPKDLKNDQFIGEKVKIASLQIPTSTQQLLKKDKI